MTEINRARQGYQQVKRQTAPSMDIELQIFRSVTHELIQTQPKDGKLLSPSFAKALTDNAQFWNVLFMDLLHPDNKLPMPLRQSLIGLAEFTQTHTHKVLQGEADARVLIDINQNMIAGLNASKQSKSNSASPVPTEPAISNHNMLNNETSRIGAI